MFNQNHIWNDYNQWAQHILIERANKHNSSLKTAKSLHEFRPFHYIIVCEGGPYQPKSLQIIITN